MAYEEPPMNENEDKIDMYDEEAVHLFSNLVSFNLNPEEICMGLAIRDVKEPMRAMVHTYIHFTIPHFIRFADLVNKQVGLLIEKGVISREPEQ